MNNVDNESRQSGEGDKPQVGSVFEALKALFFGKRYDPSKEGKITPEEVQRVIDQSKEEARRRL
jgi:lipoate-protein ligase A